MKTLELTFNAEFGTARISIRNPKEPIDPTQVKAVMNQLVATDVFKSPNGDLVSPKSARVISRETQDIELP
ncbi:DUF2922 domain-containing protein [Parageobacillus thermoglucosidasius]|jgi:Protein of unknown function (DUF2922)|uniref:DUF2922 domain-containing protein n=1 Tax=Parageobacillus thermoglucosidasius TaxID=1426 RepID=A0A1B7KVK8_PARTM|nr:DUF2922 domain-containing protein [Parageobacillus thermoglucosidasius]OAT74128.1 hypothetical protein A7K69_16345 [Parageobacillus thermoglucosidasius]